MKHPGKKLLALLLAVTLLFSGAVAVGAAAAPAADLPGNASLRRAAVAAPKLPGEPSQFHAGSPKLAGEGDTLTIVTAPTDTSFQIGYDSPNLSGLVLRASGADLPSDQTIDYTAAIAGQALGEGKIVWDFGIYPENWWQEGENNAWLYVDGYRYSNFQVMYTDPDTQEEYGYYENIDWVFGASVQLMVIGLPEEHTLPPEALAAPSLTLDTAADVDLPAWDPETEDRPVVWLKFQAPADGWYRFTSDGGKYGEQWYNREGDYIYVSGVDPLADLYGSDGLWMNYNDDSGENHNFRMTQYLEKDQVVYLRACAYNEKAVSYTVTVTAIAEPESIQSKLTVYYHDFVDIAALLEDMGWNESDVWVEWDEHFTRDCRGLYAVLRGKGYLWINTPDGTVRVEVTVKYSPAQWLCVIFLGGWAWMKYTLPGPFDLCANIRELSYYGVDEAIRTLLRDWFNWA
ncbi:MAG: hypothetical protein LBJ11_07820 [Oscillospiraceae bacterium]|jgi:hypothetical protein|nr:hypothetical protein [Oscillospiraceae bacterium]